MQEEIVFDTPEYLRINKAREEWLTAVLALLPFRQELRTALDVGCGAGYFCGTLRSAGFTVTGLDLRAKNIEHCRRRYPDCRFDVIDLDDASQLTPGAIGIFDIVLMFGILYHLESPLQVITRLAPCIGRVAMVGTRLASGDAMACYLHLEFEGDDQNDARVVAVPTFPAVIAMFAAAGLPYAYLPEFQPAHEQWDPARYENGLRKQFLVSREPINISGFRQAPAKEPLRKWEQIRE